MKLETLLKAMEKASFRCRQSETKQELDKRNRQYQAFRERILRMFDFENNAQKIAIEAYKAVIKQQQQRIAELRKEIDRLSNFYLTKGVE